MAEGPSFLAELRRRNVYRAAVFYAASAWLLVQVATQVFPFFGLPDWVVRWIVIAALVGFPFAVLFAWFYEWTPQGLKLEREVEPGESITRITGRKLDFWIIGVLMAAVVLLVTDRFVVHRDRADSVAVAPAVAAGDRSIAVLPLVNASGDRTQQYFSDGVSENLIIALSQFDGLKVIGRSSSFQFRDSRESRAAIGRKLGVAHLLEGSVQHADDAVRVSIELIDAASGRALWSQRYDRPYRDLFHLQDEITDEVASALHAKLLEGNRVVRDERPPSGNLEAYSAYLQGNFHIQRHSEDGWREALAQYTRATRIDPRYARAWVGIASALDATAVQHLEGASKQQALDRALAAVDTALAIAPDLAVAHAQRGTLLISRDMDLRGAAAEYQRAQQLAPNDGDVLFRLGQLRAALGHPEEAVILTRRALAGDPLRVRWHNWLSIYLTGLGRYDEAMQAIERAIGMQPEGTSFHHQLATIEILRGNPAAAMAAARREPADGDWHDAAIAKAAQVGTDPRAADAALARLVETSAGISAFQIAEVHALRGEPDAAFRWLDRAWANRDSGIQFLLYDPFLLRYRDDPRFAAFCRKVGLPLPGRNMTAVQMPLPAR